MEFLESLDGVINGLQKDHDESLEIDNHIAERLATKPRPSKSSGSKVPRAKSLSSGSRIQPYPVGMAIVSMAEEADKCFVEAVTRRKDQVKTLKDVTLKQLQNDVSQASQCCKCHLSTLKPLFFKDCLHAVCEGCNKKLQDTQATRCPTCRKDLQYSDKLLPRRRVAAKRLPAAEDALFNMSAALE